VNGNFANEEPRQGGEEGHDQAEPESLGEEYTLSGEDVSVGFRVPKIPKDSKDPCGHNTGPAHETVESLEDIMVIVSNPRESGHHSNNDAHKVDHPSG